MALLLTLARAEKAASTPLRQYPALVIASMNQTYRAITVWNKSGRRRTFDFGLKWQCGFNDDAVARMVAGGFISEKFL